MMRRIALGQGNAQAKPPVSTNNLKQPRTQDRVSSAEDAKNARFFGVLFELAAI